ncbi:hypothetical protein WJX77_006166 [Trebouxia sp. C0004]
MRDISVGNLIYYGDDQSTFLIDFGIAVVAPTGCFAAVGPQSITGASTVIARSVLEGEGYTLSSDLESLMYVLVFLAVNGAAHLGNKPFGPAALHVTFVAAARDVPEYDTLCEIPKEAVLSVRNSAIANLIEEEQLGGGLGLILSIMYEVSIGARSKWHAYLQSLPSREYLPLFWQEGELALLQGTELAGKADADRALTQEDWETNILPLIHDAKYPMLNQAGMNLDLFRVAASWVASRAFGVDNYHGMAMVPFADLFNHKAAVVQLGGGYFVEDVCFEDQDNSTSEEDDDVEDVEDEDEGEEVEDEEDRNGWSQEEDEDGVTQNVVQPMTLETDRGGAPTRGVMLDPSVQQDPKMRLEIGICGVTKPDGTEVLEIVAASDLKEGQEIFNTYGEHGNAELVNKYGFALADNPFDTVKLDKTSLVGIATKQMGNDVCQQRCTFLSDQSHLLEEDLEPFEVLPKGKIGPSLVMALRVLFASEEEFLLWHNLEDAMPGPAEDATAAAAAKEAGSAADAEPAHQDGLQSETHVTSHVNTKSKRHKPDPAEEESRAERPKRELSKEEQRVKRSKQEPSEEEACAELTQLSRKRQKAGSVQGYPHTADTARDSGNSELAESSQQGNGANHGDSSIEHNLDAEAHSAVALDSDSDSGSNSDSPGGADHDDADGTQLGNVAIAAAGQQVLSHKLLTGLQKAIQERLSQYSTADVQTDTAALAKLRAQANGASSEEVKARQAAFLLLIGEKTLLHDALGAIAHAFLS